jgi:long-chain acyl-CoA synthetase
VGTLARVWQDALSRHAGRTAFLVQEAAGWRPVSFPEAGDAVEEVAAGLLALGVERGHRIAILARSRLEWTLTDWASLSVGCVVVPVYPTSADADVAHVLADSDVRAIVCEDREQLDRIRRLGAGARELRLLVVMEQAGPGGGGVVSFAELRERGRALLAEQPALVASRAASVTPADVATIVYTSGTTGAPKGCVITHANGVAAIDMVRAVPDLLLPGDVVLLFLPLAHVYGRIVELVGAATGLTLAFCPDVARVAQAAASVRPTVLPTVPRLLEKVHAAAVANVESASPLRRRIGRWAFATGARASATRQDGVPVRRLLRAQLLIADRLALGKIRARLGGRVRVVISGGAALPPAVGTFLDGVGLGLVEGYGMTECTAVVSVGVPGRHRIGSVGPPLRGLHVRIAGDGEVLVQGDTVFAGYLGDEQATLAVLDRDGWLHTGDLGSLGADGVLTLTGRKKEVIVTAAGKNVSPERVEGALLTSRFVAQVLAVGSERPFVGALLVLDDDEVRRAFGAAADPVAIARQAVAEANATLGEAEQVRRFLVLPEPFTIERGEVTPSLKLKRSVILERCEADIDRMYAGRT